MLRYHEYDRTQTNDCRTWKAVMEVCVCTIDLMDDEVTWDVCAISEHDIWLWATMDQRVVTSSTL